MVSTDTSLRYAAGLGKEWGKRDSLEIVPSPPGSRTGATSCFCNSQRRHWTRGSHTRQGCRAPRPPAGPCRGANAPREMNPGCRYAPPGATFLSRLWRAKCLNSRRRRRRRASARAGVRGRAPSSLWRRSLHRECSTVITTFPFLCPCSTYLKASAICFKG